MGCLNTLAEEIYNTAKEKGWHDKPVAFGDCMANIHAELSEAWEDYRAGKPLNEVTYKCRPDYAERVNTCNNNCDLCQWGKPCGIPSELADVIIRALDACHMYGIDADKIIQEKMRFNQHRPYKHGGKVI